MTRLLIAFQSVLSFCYLLPARPLAAWVGKNEGTHSLENNLASCDYNFWFCRLGCYFLWLFGGTKVAKNSCLEPPQHEG